MLNKLAGLFVVSRLSAWVLVSCMLALPVQADSFGVQNLTVSGASPGGLWSALGVGLDKVINKAYPGSTITYQTSTQFRFTRRII